MNKTLIVSIFISTLILSACNNDNSNPSEPLASNWSLPEDKFPFGEKNLIENRQKIDLAQGVEQYKIIRGYSSLQDGFEVEIGLATNDTEFAKFETAIIKLGYSAKKVIPADNSQAGKNTSYWVRIDSRFTSKTTADDIVKLLKKDGFNEARTRYTAEDGLTTTGPWVINILAVRPSFTGKLRSALGTDIIPGKETTTSLAKRTGALAAINAGFFVVNETMGTPGDLAGLGIINGRIVSEGVEGRPAMFFDIENGQRHTHLETNLSTIINITTQQGITKRADGFNRTPGKNFNCGNPFDIETSLALHDVVCTDPNEIIVFTQDFGSKTDIGTGVEVLLNEQGVVQKINLTRGLDLPKGYSSIQATGNNVDWIIKNIQLGHTLKVNTRLVNQDTQKDLNINEQTYAVNGGPTLLMNGAFPSGKQIIQEGWGYDNIVGVPTTYNNANRAYFINDWYLRRNPHAIVGKTQDGTLLFVTVDGRAPRYSAGLSVPETAQLMKFLGAVDAMKLDGGGSTMMTINGIPQNLPSDAVGEREDGDAILIFK